MTARGPAEPRPPATDVERLTYMVTSVKLVDKDEFANDPEPFDPKVVTYEIFGPEGAAVDVNYVDLQGEPQRVDGAVLPWSITLQTTEPSAAANIVAQGKTSFLGCRVLVDGELKDERSISGTNVQTFCIVKSA